MNEIAHIRQTIRKFEDQKVSIAQLGRELLHVAQGLWDDRHSALRQALVRLSQRFTALSERRIYDDVRDEVRRSVDELYDEIATFEE